MFVVVVTLFVQPAHVADFIAASLDNARNTRKEPNNLRFDVIQAEDDPTRLMLYEVYRTKEDFASHQQTEHYFRWRDLVANWMREPRQASKLHTLFYDNSAQ